MTILPLEEKYRSIFPLFGLGLGLGLGLEFGLALGLGLVTAPICFICPTKFSNSALLFGFYFDVLVCASLCFLIFARFVLTPNFRHNAQLFCLFAEF